MKFKQILILWPITLLSIQSCMRFDLPEVPLNADIKVQEEQDYTLNRISFITDNINSQLINKKLTYNDLFDRVFDISIYEDKFIYQSSEEEKTEIYLKSMNGQIKKKLTNLNLAWDGCFANNDENFAYVYALGGFVNIYMDKLIGSRNKERITDVRTWTVNPMFSDDDSKIIYAKRDRTGGNISEKDGREIPEYKYFIYEYDVEKKENTNYWIGYNPCYFPNDNNKIAYVKISNTYPEIWIGDLTTGEEKLLLSNDKVGFVQPVVSPDGRRIAFSSLSKVDEEEQNFDVYIVNTDGTNKRQITHHPGNDYCPNWSKDGNSIYFVSQRGNRAGKYCIWKISLTTFQIM